MGNSRTKSARQAAAVSKGKPWATIVGVVVIVVLAAAVFGYIGLQNKQASDEAAARTDAVVAESERPFGQHYQGLAQRDKAAFPPETRGKGPHIHPELAVFVKGKPVKVPTNIGIYPDKQGPFGLPHVPTHTHDARGTVHVEGAAQATLGQFFQVWGVDFSRTQLGPHKAEGDKTVHMWVNGKPSRAFGELRLASEQRIVIAYGDKRAPPPTAL
jgi:hypothetical protein